VCACVHAREFRPMCASRLSGPLVCTCASVCVHRASVCVCVFVSMFVGVFVCWCVCEQLQAKCMCALSACQLSTGVGFGGFPSLPGLLSLTCCEHALGQLCRVAFTCPLADCHMSYVTNLSRDACGSRSTGIGWCDNTKGSGGERRELSRSSLFLCLHWCSLVSHCVTSGSPHSVA